ncbi:MAG: diacylglycerol kinase family protein [Saprospiraceae bacterium]
MIQKTAITGSDFPWLVIFNLSAGRGRLKKNWPRLQTELTALIPVARFCESKETEDVRPLIASALEAGIRHILAVGGDGTAHHVVNGIFQQSVVPPSEIVFALYPFGTGNDWVKTHNIPKKWAAWKELFLQYKLHRQTVGLITFQTKQGPEERYFINVAGMAYDAFVVRFLLNRSSILPSKLFYLWATFRCLFAYTPQSGMLQLDNKHIHTSFYTINAGIGQYSGGGMQLVPHAKPTRRELAVTYVGKVSRLEVLLNSHRFYKGRIAQYSEARLHEASFIRLIPDANNSLFIEADGEFLGHSP